MFSIVNRLKTKTFEGVENIVIGADWIYTISLGGCDFRFHGSSAFEYNPDSLFIAYPEITEQTVIGWIESHVSQAELAFYAEKAQEHLDAFKEVPKHTDVWAVYKVEQNQEVPWKTKVG